MFQTWFSLLNSVIYQIIYIFCLNFVKVGWPNLGCMAYILSITSVIFQNILKIISDLILFATPTNPFLYKLRIFNIFNFFLTLINWKKKFFFRIK